MSSTGRLASFDPGQFRSWVQAKAAYPIGTDVLVTVVRHAPFGMFANPAGRPEVSGLIDLVQEYPDGPRSLPDAAMWPAVGSQVLAVVVWHHDGARQLRLHVKSDESSDWSIDNTHWNHGLELFPLGAPVRVVVARREPYGLVVHLRGSPQVTALIDLASYRPDGDVHEMYSDWPQIGEQVSAVVASHNESLRQIRLRVGLPRHPSWRTMVDGTLRGVLCDAAIHLEMEVSDLAWNIDTCERKQPYHSHLLLKTSAGESCVSVDVVGDSPAKFPEEYGVVCMASCRILDISGAVTSEAPTMSFVLDEVGSWVIDMFHYLADIEQYLTQSIPLLRRLLR